MNNVINPFACITLEKPSKLRTDLKQTTKPTKKVHPQHMTVIIPIQ